MAEQATFLMKVPDDMPVPEKVRKKHERNRAKNAARVAEPVDTQTLDLFGHELSPGLDKNLVEPVEPVEPPTATGASAVPPAEIQSGTGGTDALAEAINAAESVNPDDESATEVDAEVVRPSYVVREDWQEITDSGGGVKKLRPGVWWHSSRTDKQDKVHDIDDWICAPLYVDAVTCGDDAHDFGRMLRFRDSYGRWKQWAMPMEMLRGSCEELRGELLAAGLEIELERARKHLPAYLQWRTPKKRITAATRTGWTAEQTAFVLPRQVIGNAGEVYFQSEKTHFSESASTRGSLEHWQRQVAKPCAGNPVLVLSVCIALAGPLLRVTHQESGGVHWHGKSSKGKSTGLWVGASCWGGGPFIRTWQSTSNGLEGMAALVNDTCLCLDEIKQAKAAEVDAAIYALGNGTGKTRANRFGSARNAHRWRITMLSTGEKTVTAHMAEANKTPDAGVLVRLLNIKATDFAHGAFEHLNGFASGQALADHLKTACNIDYGWAGPRFVWEIIEAKKRGRDFGAELAALKALPALQVNDSQTGRVAARLALYALAGELAIEWGIVPWPTGHAIEAVLWALNAWKAEHGGGGDAERRAVLQAVGDYIGRFGDLRFTHKDDRDSRPSGGQRAGWWIINPHGERVYLFTSAALREAVPGKDLDAIASELDKAGWLAAKDHGLRCKKTKTPDGGSPRLYYVLPIDAPEVLP